MRLLLLSLFIFISDQASKIWIKSNFELYESTDIIGNYLRFTFCENPGIAFGIRVGSFHIIITLLSYSIAIGILVSFYIERNNNIILRTSLALILGGAIGNLFDRTLMIFGNYEGVIDFIDLGLNENLRWYIFNIADASITCGIILYFIFSSYIIKNSKPKLL